jgi:cell division transport system permease protein
MATNEKKRSGARSVTSKTTRPAVKAPKVRKAGASKPKNSSGLPKSTIHSWAHSHLRALFSSLGRQYSAPASTLLTAAVIGIALALPSFLFLLVDKAQVMADRWKDSSEFAVYLNTNVDDLRASQIAADIRVRDDIRSVTLVTKTQAAAEFRENSAFGGALDLLDSNPLPAVLLVTPASLDPQSAERTIRAIEGYPQVDQVKLDREWLERLQSILNMADRTLDVILGLLAFAVIIVVGNTIRLDIENRRQEIVVMKLVGGTDAFVRRPFLYSGAWYGLLGGLLSIVLVTITVLLLEGPLNRLVGDFGGDAIWLGHGFGSSAYIILAGTLFGWLGSWLAVTRELRDIEPT